MTLQTTTGAAGIPGDARVLAQGDAPWNPRGRRRGWESPGAPRGAVLLLDLNGGAGALEGSLGLLRGLLVDLLQDGLRRAVDQVLGLLEAEAGERTHLLDDLDLLVASGLEDDVELVLLLRLRPRPRPLPPPPRRPRRRPPPPRPGRPP